MNRLRKKVIASAAMLLIATVMVTTSSFAWYTLSKQGEVQEVDVNISATDNLEISKADTGNWSEYASKSELEVYAGDAGNEYKWGSRVTQWEYSLATTSVPATLSSTGKLQSLNYAPDGRAVELVDAVASGMNNGQEKFTVNINKEGSAQNKECAVGYGVWLRSNNDLSDVTAKITGVDPANNDKVVVGLIVKEKNTAGTALQDATVTKNSDGETVFSLTANEPKFVELVLFYDGDKILARDVEDGLTQNNIKVTFTSQELLDKGASVNPSQN